MSDPTADASLRKTAGIAGLAFLFILAGYTISWSFVYSRLIAAGNVTANGLIRRRIPDQIGCRRGKRKERQFWGRNSQTPNRGLMEIQYRIAYPCIVATPGPHARPVR